MRPTLARPGRQIFTTKSGRAGRTIMTGLSGHEMFCLDLKGYEPGELIIGNSVYSLGFLGSIGAGLQVVFGGEVSQITSVIAEGRRLSQDRLLEEAQRHGADGLTGVTSELSTMQGNTEFLSVASCIRHKQTRPDSVMFSTSVHGQDLYCLLDAGYQPLQFVFGNVAYSVGVVGGILGSLKTLARGEIKEFSDVFNKRATLRSTGSRARRKPAAAMPWLESRPAFCRSRGRTKC